MNLTDEQIDSAVKYNNEREYDRDLWVDIQFRINSDADGLPGKATAQSVANFQAEYGLGADGKVGANTLDKLNSLATPWQSIEEVSIWCDLPASWCVDRADRIADEMLDLGIDALQLQLNKSGDPEFHALWTARQLAVFSAALLARGVRTGLMPWSYPSRKWIERFGVELPALLAAIAGGCYEIDHDIEGPWSPSKLEGYATTEEASDHLRQVTQAAVGCSSTKLATSTFYDAISSGNTARRYAVEHLGDICGAQMYANTSNGGPDFYGSKGPCRRASGEVARFRGLVSHVVCGAAAYSMSFDGHDPVEALRRHVECGLWSVMRSFRSWSLKHILSFWFSGDAENQADQRIKHEYNGRWFRELKGLRGDDGADCPSS